MQGYRKLTTICCAAVLALGLAACGGGGDDDTADAPTTMEPTGPTPDEQIATLQAEINALRAELGLDPIDIDDLTGSVSDLQGQVATLMQQVADRDTAMAEAEAEKMRMEMAATGRLLYGALAGNATVGTNALANIDTATTQVSLSSAGLVIDAAAGAGALLDAINPPSVTLTAGDSVGSLGTWAGTMYSHTQGSGPSKITNEAVVYTNRGAHAGPSRPFAEMYAVETSGALRGYFALTPADHASLIRGDAFDHSGRQSHTAPRGADAFTAPGTFNGAPGTYRCVPDGVTACSSTNDGRAGPSAITGTWHFKPDVGAMTSPADTIYLYYGWWVSKDADDDPTAASAFTGTVFPSGGSAPTSGTGETLTGSATYAGHAAGKFAIHRTADGSNNGGHFTADAMLTAKFGAIAALNSNGVTGTIDNFRLNDGSEDPGWSVRLNRSSAWAADGVITGPTSAATVWSIDGNAGAASGSWSGQMYDETPGDPPAGDGSTVPTTVTGTFYSEFGGTHRMVGGFAAEKQ